MTIFNLITLFGGLALFLYGMRLMGDGLKKGSSDAFKRAMEKVTNNPLVGFLLGLVVTAVIQSSTATIVLTSGLVGAGVMSLHQSIGVILGANVGTTITGQIIRLLDVNASETSLLNFFKPSTLAPLAAIIGILFLMAVKTRQSDTIGSIAMGFGILFTGLLSMTAAVSPLSESETFANMFYQLSGKPVLGFLLGAGVAFLLQSSSATIGILQAIATTGALTFSSVYAIIIGVNIGDCVTTAIVCSIGSKADAKRTGVIHILFNIAGSILVIVGLMLLHSFGVLDALWDEALSSGGIANVHTVFRLVSAIVLLPVCGQFEKLSRKLVKDDVQLGENVDHERFLSEVLQPALRGEAVTYHPFRCARQALDEPVTVPAARLTIVEGAYACHPALWDSYDLRVFLTVDAAEQLRRIEARSGPEKLRMFRDRWIPLEESYFTAFDLPARCDMALKG